MTEESSDAPTTADADVFMSSITLSTFPSLAANLSKLNLRNQGFVQVPAEVWACEQLTQLDIGGNPVTALEGIQALGKLRIFFATGCKLGPVLPPDGPLAQVGSLTMLSLADNGLKVLDGAALPASLEWLIAKQNQLVEVRNAYRLCRVRKLGLAHNQLDTEMVRTLVRDGGAALELLRISCNPIESLPEELWSECCPKLAWFGCAGSPYHQRHAEAALALVSAEEGVQQLADGSEVEVGAELGRGSGAVVREGAWRGKPVAVKVWHDACSSDGLARDEWQMGQLTGGCPDLVRALAAWEQPALGMAVELLRGASAVGGPPNFDSCTRDTFTEDKHARRSAAGVLHVALAVCRACAWMHARGLCHGDVYLHNTLLVPPGDGGDGGDVRLSDLGATCAYDRAAGDQLERVEVRSFARLVHDLLSWLTPPSSPQEHALVARMASLADECDARSLEEVPTFARVAEQLTALLPGAGGP